jgi:hypothetical protein
MNKIDIGKLPIKIEKVEYLRVDLLIGDLPAAIIEPKPSLLNLGFVYLVSTDSGKARWPDLISCDMPCLGGVKKSFSNDPRLVEIGKDLGLNKFSVGQILPPNEITIL